MADAVDPHSESTGVPRAPSREPAASAPNDGPPTQSSAASATPATPPEHTEPAQPPHPWRKRLIIVAVLAGLAYGIYALIPAIQTALNTVSTDDAYVNGHVTFLAPGFPARCKRCSSMTTCG